MSNTPAANGHFVPNERTPSVMTAGAKPTTEGERTTSTPITNGGTNGTIKGVLEGLNGHLVTHSESQHGIQTTQKSETRTTKSQINSHSHFTRDQQVTILKDNIMITRRKLIGEFEQVDESFIDTTTIEGFLEYIERQRLTHMPHRGSRWDKVLRWAEFYALQTFNLEKSISKFVQDSRRAAKLIWTACRALLELGPGNAQALEVTFGVFYKLGLSLSFFQRNRELLSVNSHIRGEVGGAFNDMLLLVCDVSIYYRAKISELSSGSVQLDFNLAFGRHMDSFYRRKDHITDAMWEYSLGDDVSSDTRSIRKWLSPQDSILQAMGHDRLEVRSKRDEYTCEYFQRPLLDFSRSEDNVLAVVGPAGCGKTVLHGWITERLQRPLGRKVYETLSYTVEADVPSESTALAVVKNFLLQLLEASIGDENLFNKLESVHKRCLKDNEVKDLEDSLWDVLNVGLKGFSKKTDNLMFILDGIDEVNGGEASSQRLWSRMANVAAQHQWVSVLVLSRIPCPPGLKGKLRTFTITADHTHNDLQHIIGHSLEGYAPLQHLNEFQLEKIVEQFVQAANGSFLWSVLTLKALKKEKTSEAFMKAFKEAPRALDATIQNLFASLDLTNPDAKLLLSWMAVAERPLTVVELKHLLQIDLQKKASTEKHTDVVEDIRRILGPLVTNRNGIIRFRHNAIRSHIKLVQKEGKKLPSERSAQNDLTMRILTYGRICFTKKSEPTFEFDMMDIKNIFKQHLLLEYTVRYWTVHFKRSSMWKDDGSLELSPDFKAIFPSSLQFAVTEWACWEFQTSLFETMKMHHIALRVRQDVFSENHESVLQCLIIYGLYQLKLGHAAEACKYFYRASRVGQVVLHKHNAITVTCATYFLSCTETMTITTRTEVVTWKEQLLRYLIETYKSTHGRTNDIVIRYYRVLAQLYVDIHEEHQATIIWRELHEIIVARYGKGSEEDTSVSKEMSIVLRNDKKHDVSQYGENIFDISETVDEWNLRSVRIKLDLALDYESRKQYVLSEEIYIRLWRTLTEKCHDNGSNYGVDIHIHVIDVVLEYARFLRRLNRHEEASNILICIWTEYEEFDFDSEILFLRLKVVGELMRLTGLLSVAVTVFRRVWGWFKAHGKHEHEASCAVLISETVTELTTISTTTETTTTTTTTTSVTETVIKELFEASVSQTTVSSETVSICQTLISYYIKREQWLEAISTSRRSLVLVWKSFFSGGGICALPKAFGTEAIEISLLLAICYHRSQSYHEAGDVYLRVYRACRHSCNIHDERLTKVSAALIKFYEEHKRWQKVIEIYKELLVEYRTHLGSSHALTIRTLYLLGSLCADHGHGYPDEFYEEIVVILNKGGHICHHDAMEAMIVLCRRYYEEGHWNKLKDICTVLWQTWVDRHKEHKFEDYFVEELYMRYIYVLEHHDNCDYEILRKVTIEYHATCVKVFGASVAITIKALIELGAICMRSEKYVHEAISHYEEVITKTTTTTTTTTTVVSTTTITTIKEKLTKAYIKVSSHASTSTTTISRAIKVITERYEYLKSTLGSSHSETLLILRELILIYRRLETKEAGTTILRLLQEASLETIRTEKHSRKLHEAATTLGEIYVVCGISKHGLDILYELRRQVIAKNYSSASNFGFKLEHHHGRISFVFFATFESVLRGASNVSYSEIMADLLTESILYEHYTRCLRSEKDIESIIIHGGRLRIFLITQGRIDEVKMVEQRTFEIFKKRFISSIKSHSDGITFVFYLGILQKLGQGSKEKHIGHVACIASDNQVRSLLEQYKFEDAYHVAECAFNFINHQKAYHHLHNIGYGFKLSGYMVARGLSNPDVFAKIKPDFRTRMQDLSQAIIRDVLESCKEADINFVRMQLGELNRLIALLGAQQNYKDLEWLLRSLWSSREVQRTWSTEIIVSIGCRYVQAKYLAGDRPGAIKLCEDICYNLRRVKGSLDPETLKVSELLSDIYIDAGHYRESMGVHEEILRLAVEGDDDDERTIDTLTPQKAREHLNLLMRSFQRLKGWDKGLGTYSFIVNGLIQMYKGSPEWQGVQSIDQWNKTGADDSKVKLLPPKEWEFVREEDLANIVGKVQHIPGAVEVPRKITRKSVRRASSWWGLGHHHSSDSSDDDIPPVPVKQKSTVPKTAGRGENGWLSGILHKAR